MGNLVLVRRDSVATPWYLSGGIAAANCIAAYQPKGAANIATSYVNLANPGTYNATVGNRTPTFDALTGWTFNGTDQYLNTGIVPVNDQSWSMFVRFSDAVTSYKWCVGSYIAASNVFFAIEPRRTDNTALYGNGDYLSVAGGATQAGVLGVAGNKAYKNGNAIVGTISAKAGTFVLNIYIGATPTLAGYWGGKIQALAIYNTAITAPQVTALYTAIAAL